MLNSISTAFFAASLVVSITAQTPAPAKPSDKAPKVAPLVLTGCVASPESGHFTVQDAKNGRFELSGHGLDIYIGKRVELRGNPSGGLHITTGLYPSPNVAAQAGAMDPVQAAQAALPGGAAHGTGSQPLPKFAVTNVKTVKGDCK